MDTLMTIWVFFIGSIIGIILGITLSYRTSVNPLQETIKKLTYHHHFNYQNMKYYPYNLDNFRFIGDPIDGIQFEENTILFVRLIKANETCTKIQEQIKNLINGKNVKWFEFTTE